MSEQSPQPERAHESRDITTTETLDQLLGSGIVTFATKDGITLPVFEGDWKTLPSDLGTFFDGLNLYLQDSDLGNISTIHVYFGKKNQRTELEGVLPYGMIVTRQTLLDQGELIALNFMQYNTDETLLVGLMKDSTILLDQLMNFFPQCEDKPNIELIRLLAPVIIDGFREGHLKEVVQQTAGSTHFSVTHELLGDWKQLPWGMGGARTWKFKTVQGSDEQTIHSLLIWILDQLDRFDIEFNKYMSIQGRTDFLAQIMNTAFAELATFVGTPLEWLDQVEKATSTITPTTNQEQRMLDFFRNEMKRYVAKLAIPSLVRAYVEMLHENKGDSTEFEHIKVFEELLQETLMNTLDQGAALPVDPRKYIQTQISGIFSEFRRRVDISSRGAFNALVTQTLESIPEFSLPKIVLDSGYLLKSLSNLPKQWPKNAGKRILEKEGQLTEQSRVLDAEQKEIDEKSQILAEQEKILAVRSESLRSEKERITTRERALNDEKTKMHATETHLNAERSSIEAEKQVITQKQVQLDESAGQLSVEDQQLTTSQDTILTEKANVEEELSALITNLEDLKTENADVEAQINSLSAQESVETQLVEKEKIEGQLSTLAVRVEGLLTKKAGVETQLSTLTTELKALITEKTSIEEQLTALAAKVETEDLTTVKALLDEQLSNLVAREADLINEKKSIEGQFNTLTADLETLTAEKANLEAQFNSLTANGEILTAEKIQQEEQLQHTATLVASSETKRDSLVRQIQEYDEKLKMITDQREALNVKTATLDQERSALAERTRTLKVREDTWNTNINKLQEDRERWTSDLTTLQNEKSELETALSTLEQDRAHLAEERASLEAGQSALREKVDALESEQKALVDTKATLESYSEFLRKKIEQEFGEIEVYEIDKITKITQAALAKVPTYLDEVSSSGKVEPIGEEWTTNLLEGISLQYEVVCDFEEVHEHMRYWASPVGGIYPQRIEIFFTDPFGERTGDVLFLFQDHRNRFSKQVGVTLAKGTADGTLLLRDLRDISRQICEHHDSQIWQDLGEQDV